MLLNLKKNGFMTVSLVFLVFVAGLQVSALPTRRTKAAVTPKIYCSSFCADYVGACFGTDSNSCYACDSSSFRMNSDTGICERQNQNQVVAHDLKSQSLSISGYETSKPEVSTCGSYSLSGKYVKNDYIANKFHIPNSNGNHYQLVVKFVVGYIGSWSSTDKMSLTLNSQVFQWEYSCDEKSDECSGSAIDCFKIISQTIDHQSDQLTFNLTSYISNDDPALQSWGVRELLIIAKTCSPSCTQCFGPLDSQCLSCQSGRYLLGNKCVEKCPILSIPDKHTCTQQCPQRYYNHQNTQCAPCSAGCLTCDSKQKCLIFQDGSTNQSFISKNLLAFILLLLLSLILFIFLLWKLVIQKRINDRRVKSEQDSTLNDRIMQQSIQPKKEQLPQKKSENIPSDPNSFSTIKFNNEECEKTFEDVGLKWIETIPEGSQVQLNSENLVNVKKRPSKRLRPQNSSAIQIKQKKKDEVDRYYHGEISIENNDL